MTEDDRRRGPAFWVAFALGCAIMGYGLALMLSTRDGAAGATRIAGWIAAGHVVHDVVVVPAVLLVGAAVSTVTTSWLRGPVRAGLIATACVVAVAYPALRGFGTKPRNPSVLPLDYDRAVLTAVGVAWALVVAAAVMRFLRRTAPTRRAPDRDTIVTSAQR